MTDSKKPQLPQPDEVRALREESRSLEQVVSCRHSAEQLWPYFSQVDLYNRAGGSSAVDYEVIPNLNSAAVICGTTEKLGLKMRYRELPYEWHQPKFVHAEMFYYEGPFRYSRIRGEHLRERSAVRYSIDYVPRYRFGISRLIAHSILKKFVAIFRGIDERLPESFSDPLGVKGFEDKSKSAQRREADLAQSWRHLAIDTVVSKELAKFIVSAPDRFVGRMRPYALAQQFGTSQRETLEFCCLAAREEFLDLSWDLICPSCGGAKKRSPELTEMDSTAHCEVCNIRYDADLASNVELSFRPNPDVRELDEGEYCLQSPSHQLQILAQVNIEPETTHHLSLSLQPGHYRLRCIGFDGEALFNCAYGRPRQEIAVSVGERIDIVEINCGPALELLLENDTPYWRTVRFEHHGYREDAACAAEVIKLPEFYESFGKHVPLPPV